MFSVNPIIWMIASSYMEGGKSLHGLYLQESAP